MKPAFRVAGSLCLAFCLLLPSLPAAAETGFPVTVVDQGGRSIQIKEEPLRIVSGYYISTSICIALGLADRLAGIETGAAKRNIYALSQPRLLDIPDVGSAKAFDLEGCVRLEPDLVILPLRLSDAADTLTLLGIDTILVNPENHDLLMEAVALIGQAAGVPERSGQLLDYYREKLDYIESLSEKPDKPVVYLAGNSSYLTCAPGGMYQSSLITAAGGVNAGAGLPGAGWAQVSYEQILSMDPEYIFLPSEKSYAVTDILNDEQLRPVSAVRAGRVFAMPSAFEPWDSPVPSGILGTLWALHILREEEYPEEEFVRDAVSFYETFYHFTPDKELLAGK